jgi:hypothetical protein
MATIRYGNEYWMLHADGAIERPGLVNPHAESWRVIGAVRLNNLGSVIERYSLTDILNKRIEWRYKNGKQRVHIIDIDHGTLRMWMNPNHEII